MKEFLAGFQVDTEHKELAGVCAGIGNYFNIQANIVRLVTVLLFLSSTEVGILTMTLYAYLAGWLGNEPLGGWSKKSKKSSYSISCCLFDFGITWNRRLDRYLRIR